MIKLFLFFAILYFVWKSMKVFLAPPRSSDWQEGPDFRERSMPGSRRREKDITSRTRILNENSEDDR